MTMISDQLDLLREHHPECDIAAFADVSTGMVLSATSRDKVSQERLDSLCFTAADALDGPLTRVLNSNVLIRAQDAISYVIKLFRGQLVLFVRSDRMPEEALCFVCDSAVNVETLVQEAQALLTRIDAEQ